MRPTQAHSPYVAGLCLASGGARGAYQAGALLALAERGERYDRIIGTSIGALNGAFYAQSDGSVGAMHALCDLWREVPVVLKPNIKNLRKLFFAPPTTGPISWSPIISRIIMPGWEVVETLMNPAWSAFEDEPIRELLRKWLRYELIQRGRKEFLITTYNTRVPTIGFLASRPTQNITYMRAQALTTKELENALLASAAIPFIFPAQPVDGTYHNDAGVMLQAHATQVLVERNTPRVTTILLRQNDPATTNDFPNADVRFIRPSRKIASPLSALNFKQDVIESLIELGYKDVKESRKGPRSAA